MLNLTNLPILKNNHEWLMDNDEYLMVAKTESGEEQDYLIVYSYSTDFLSVIQELISFNIEFSHHPDHLSDESYLLINTNQYNSNLC